MTVLSWPLRAGCRLSAVVALLVLAFGCASQGPGKKDPEAATEQFNLSINLANEWDFQGALAAVERAIELDPGNAKYFMFKGTYEKLLGDRMAALRGLDKAIELEPGNPRYYNNRAANLVALRLYDEAMKDIERVFEIGEDNYVGASLDSLAWIHFFKGNFDAAGEVLDRMERDHPGLPVEILRFRIIQETEGIEKALHYGQAILDKGEQSPWGFNAMRLLMAQVDLRDIEIHHVFELGSYMFILDGYEFKSPGTPASDGSTQQSREDSPVILIRDIQTMRADEALGPVLANVIRGALIEKTLYRVVDDESRTAALEELETALAGLTEGERDVELGRFLAADYILSGSFTSAQGQLLCNITIMDSQTAEIRFSKFIILENFEALTSAVEALVQDIPRSM